MAVVQARKIKAKDLWLLSRILLHMGPEITQAIDGAMTRGEKLDWERMGLPIIFDLLEQADSNLRELLAGLADVTVERFDELDLADVLEVVRQVSEQLMEDGPRFFASFGTMLKIREPISTASSPATTGPTTSLEPLRPSGTSRRRSAAS